MAEERYIISFSGGQTSAYMTQWCMKNLDGQKVIVFANTGCEHEKTYEFVEEFERFFGWPVRWVEAEVQPQFNKGTRAKEVTPGTASKNGEPFEDVIAKYGIPNTTTPHCTRELKTRTIMRFARDHLGWRDYWTVIGIRSDEQKRINVNAANKHKLYYPIAKDNPMTKEQINAWWKMMPFRLDIPSYKGNCVWCWKKSFNKLAQVAKEEPEAFEFPKRMEEKYGQYTPPGRAHKMSPPYRFFREEQSVQDIFEIMEEGEYTHPRDESEDTSILGGCDDHCEAFAPENPGAEEHRPEKELRQLNLFE